MNACPRLYLGRVGIGGRDLAPPERRAPGESGTAGSGTSGCFGSAQGTRASVCLDRPAGGAARSRVWARPEGTEKGGVSLAWWRVRCRLAFTYSQFVFVLGSW
jgi:hypothetical protein